MSTVNKKVSPQLELPVSHHVTTVGSWCSAPLPDCLTIAGNEENSSAGDYCACATPSTVDRHPLSVISTRFDGSAQQQFRHLSTSITCPLNQCDRMSETPLSASLIFATPSSSTSCAYQAAYDVVHPSTELPCSTSAGDGSGVSRPGRLRRRTKRQPYSKDAIGALTTWYEANRHHPYADRATTERLADLTKLTYGQVRKWLANARAVDKARLVLVGSDLID